MMTIVLPLSAAFIVKLRFSDKHLSLSLSSDVKFDFWWLGFFSSSVTSFLVVDIIFVSLKGVSWFGLK